MINAVLSLGCNIGNRYDLMQKMEKHICSILKPPLVFSDLMETEPLGMPQGTNSFFNRIVSGFYENSAHELLQKCLSLEKILGRVRTEKTRDRTSDIDILIFGSTIISSNILTIPHPEIFKRAFCMHGLMQTSGNTVHPVSKKTFLEIYNSMSSDIKKQKINVIASGYLHELCT